LIFGGIFSLASAAPPQFSEGVGVPSPSPSDPDPEDAIIGAVSSFLTSGSLRTLKKPCESAVKILY
jgi:hypothetical protein